METEMTQIDHLTRALDEAVARHIADIKIISDCLNVEARENEWCSRYDKFQREVNAQLSVPLEVREHDYQGIVVLTVRMRRTVTATSEEQVRMALLDDTKSIGFVRSDDSRYFISEFVINDINVID